MTTTARSFNGGYRDRDACAACASIYFRYSEKSRRAVSQIRPPGFVFSFHITGKASGDVRKLMRELGHGARHVIIRGHDDQRVEILLLRPAPGLEALPNVLSAERSRSTQQLKILRMRASGGRSPPLVVAVHPGDQQPPAALGGQQFDRVAIREAPPVRTTIPSALRSSTTSSVGDLPDEPEEPPASTRQPTAPRHRRRRRAQALPGHKSDRHSGVHMRMRPGADVSFDHLHPSVRFDGMAGRGGEHGGDHRDQHD